MGLDTVEIILEVEDTFGISIGDDTTTLLGTVGELHEYILNCRRRTDESRCPTARVFREIRRVLLDTSTVHRRAVRPSACLRETIPVHERRRVWFQFQRIVSGRLPHLRLPYRLGPLMAGVCITAGILGTAVMAPRIGPGHALVLGLVSTLTLLLFTFSITRPLAVALPTGVTTIGDLVGCALPTGHEVSARRQLSDDEVWEKLREIVAEVLCVPAERITPRSRFVEDLGAD